MQKQVLGSILMASFGMLLITGCASTTKHATPLTKEQILEQPDVKKKAPVVFKKGVDDVRQAGVRALTFVGCEVKVQEPFFLAGRRPNKVGLFVGSGGETIKMFLYPPSETETHVWVDTDMSFVGIAGQQTWDDKVFAELKNLLEQPAKTP
jgi:hypothetical protein